MSRNSTIELLNETDALGYRMRWQLFVQENERVVYGNYTGWQPGEFLHRHPHSIRADPHISDELEEEFENVGGSWGGYVRPMFEIMENDAFHISPLERIYISPADPWCGACHVTWEGEYGDECWSCGLKSYGPYITEKVRFDLQTRLFNEARRAREDRQMAVYAAAVGDDLDHALYTRFIRSYSADIDFTSLGLPPRPTTPSPAAEEPEDIFDSASMRHLLRNITS